MFYTLTANPAVDMTVSSSPLEPDENVRTGSASYTANGKGLDVSFAFKKMGVDTVALGFFAGFTGKFIVEEVMNLGCLCRPVWTDGITRINTYVNDGQHEYGILNPGAPITPQHQEELYNILDTAGDLECLIVSGSVPPKATPDFLAQVMEHAQARGADVVLDLSSDKLKELAHKKPLLIKPNHHEMKAIFGVPVDTDDEVRVAMKMAHDAGVQNVLLTRGSRGDAYFSNGEDIWYAKREFNIKLVSSVCAGDCTLAAFLHKWYRDRDNVEEAMKLAHDAGVQNVLLTRGSRGDAYFSNGEDIWYAKREFNIKLVSSVCAGDCTLAAFLHKWYRDRDNVEEAMKLAMATGANVAESVGIGDFGHVDEYSKRVAVRKLDRQ